MGKLVQVDTLAPGLYLGTNEGDSLVAEVGGFVSVFIAARGGADVLDAIDVNDKIDGEGIPPSQGVAIFESLISGGTGVDQIAGTALGVNSIGIASSSFDLGPGDDRLVARGDAFGVLDVKAAGGDGMDLFDIQNGVAILDGGPDTDTLRLVGVRTDYTYQTLDPETQAGAILGFDSTGAITTDVVFNSIELFEFLGEPGTFTYGEIFTPDVA